MNKPIFTPLFIILFIVFTLIFLLIGLSIIKSGFKKSPGLIIFGVILSGFIGMFYFWILHVFDQRKKRNNGVDLDSAMDFIAAKRVWFNYWQEQNYKNLKNLFAKLKQTQIKTTFNFDQFDKTVMSITSQMDESFTVFQNHKNFTNLKLFLINWRIHIEQKYPNPSIKDLITQFLSIESTNEIDSIILEYFSNPNINNLYKVKNLFRNYVVEMLLDQFFTIQLPKWIKDIESNLTKFNKFAPFRKRYQIDQNHENLKILIKAYQQVFNIKVNCLENLNQDFLKMKFLFNPAFSNELEKALNLKSKIKDC